VLTADLVSARRRGAELFLVPMDAAARGRALDLARTLIAAAASHVGRTRDDLDAAIHAVEIGPRDHRLRDGLAKLIEDRSVFDPGDADAETLRREVFTRASRARRSLEAGGRLDRETILAEIGAGRGRSPDSIDAALFADLRGAHRLVTFDALPAEALVSSYERAQAQAVLLRAVKVTADVRCATPGALRALFRRLKFLQLLYTITRTGDGHRVVIDGPFSLFESVTKYGLQLALVLPALEACNAWKVEADVRWGKQRTPLLFRLSGEAPSGRTRIPDLPDEVRALATSFAALGTPWRVSPSSDILDLPGVGLTVPDLVFDLGAGKTRRRVYLEVMGYWSRDAVWKRVELVKAGLSERIVFAVSSRLRVSEDVLGGDLPGELYVYKRTMSARALAERLDRLTGSESPP
jgi:predicted nuclease of restriction endonuclease-like RecB superfamily